MWPMGLLPDCPSLLHRIATHNVLHCKAMLLCEVYELAHLHFKIKDEPSDGGMLFPKKKEESGDNSNNSMDVSVDTKPNTDTGESQEARNSPLPSASTPSAPATPATPSTSQTKQPRQKKGKHDMKFISHSKLGERYVS